MANWQIALRSQFAKDHPFVVEKISPETVYADYQVINPTNRNSYRVALRSPDHQGNNFCSCYDFRINRLGTCKHIEAVFQFIRKKYLLRHLKTPVERGYSSVYLDYRYGKQVMLRIGAEMTEELALLSLGYFDNKLRLTEHGFAKFEVFLQKALASCPDFRCYDDALKYQWKTEIEKFSDQRAMVVDGNAPVRHRIHTEDDTTYKIASYHSALFDARAMNDAGYDLIILDEAQRIKNWRTKIAQSVRKVPSRYVFVLTGTPIENNLDELYGLVQFVDPFALGSRHVFFPRYQTVDANGRVIGYENLGEIRELLAERLIRRTKKQVLKQLPPRNDKYLILPMTPQQREMHREFADQVAKLVSKWQRLRYLDEQDRQRLLRNLNMMRMVCDSTYIIDQQSNHQTKVDELRSILSEILEIEGEKAVIFSQWARMNDLVAKALDEMGVQYRYLHGGIPGKDRGALYTDFNQDPEVRVFLSTDAGGVGLNLQAAAWMINLDIPWNPGTLEQRIGRIYRLGQDKPVNIINLVAQETIEHNMLGVLQFKKGLAAGVLDDGEEVIFMGDSKFKKFMASVEVITRGTTESAEGTAPDQLDPHAEAVPGETAPDAAAAPEPLLGDSAEAQPDDDFEPAEEVQPEKTRAQEPSHANSANAAAPEALVQQGLQFFGQLARTLSDPKASAQLLKTIVQKDEHTGQTYIKLPVENEQVVANVLNLLGALLKG